jgi:hypothetical protein
MSDSNWREAWLEKSFREPSFVPAAGSWSFIRIETASDAEDLTNFLTSNGIK